MENLALFFGFLVTGKKIHSVLFRLSRRTALYEKNNAEEQGLFIYL